MLILMCLPSLKQKVTFMFPQLPEGLAFGVEAEVAEPEVSRGALVFLGIVVFTIIVIYVVHLIMMVSGIKLLFTIFLFIYIFFLCMCACTRAQFACFSFAIFLTLQGLCSCNSKLDIMDPFIVFFCNDT